AQATPRSHFSRSRFAAARRQRRPRKFPITRAASSSANLAPQRSRRQSCSRASIPPMAFDSTRSRPAIFLDRDGTLMEDVDYCREPADVRIYPGVSEALRQLKMHGFANVIITNQSGI